MIKIACYYSRRNPQSFKVYQQLTKNMTFVNINKADVVLAIGGDGFFLKVLNKLQKHQLNQIPIYGINTGNLGYLLNTWVNTDELLTNLSNLSGLKRLIIYPLVATCIYKNTQKILHAFNEITMMRINPLAAHLQVIVNNATLVDNLTCDGILVASKIGSHAYNASCGGKVLDINQQNNLVITAINQMLPKKINSNIFTSNDTIKIINRSITYRKVLVSADLTVLKNVNEITISYDTKHTYTLLYNHSHPFYQYL